MREMRALGSAFNGNKRNELSRKKKNLTNDLWLFLLEHLPLVSIASLYVRISKRMETIKRHTAPNERILNGNDRMLNGVTLTNRTERSFVLLLTRANCNFVIAFAWCPMFAKESTQEMENLWRGVRNKRNRFYFSGRSNNVNKLRNYDLS